jgi:hypothetical protein
MNDAQIIAISITVLAVLAGSVFNNLRIGDLNVGLNHRIDDLRDVLRAELLKETAGIRSLIERNQDALLTELARIDQRVTRLEDRMH